ncbi:hypothetical protein P154DRAFT_564502 [Amniculicola lignicola CBS 123094]|uniref:SH3 domain-containing protein n=1 Tax=Amniculicola lignicola CBS 123094 TaxID=1392246 RepID=A0A6A5WCW9_9PLEO|nr:hypothetical protein P154DRAFT_564502 [Amniculicola lignicola CBS 123094]
MEAPAGGLGAGPVVVALLALHDEDSRSHHIACSSLARLHSHCTVLHCTYMAPRGDSVLQPVPAMPHFKVKAVYDYASPHDDDLSFPAGQVITVTEEEDADWYIGEYIDAVGNKQDGLFPKNFVEKYEPEPPPRPNRASRYKPVETPAAQEVPPTPEIAQPEPAPVEQEEPEPPKPKPPPVEIPPPAKSVLSPTSPIPPAAGKSHELPQEPPAAPKPSSAAPAAKKPPPPVAAKSSSFRDRIAAFNAPAAAPLAPFKPGGGPPATFIKKPFVAPPPSRNAYVPPPRETPQVKSYRRDEDPEIAERQVQDQDNAERAGLAGPTSPTANEGDEDQPKPTSLKERIALLQKQQQEQAERAAAMHKEKPKKPPMRKRTESHDPRGQDSEDAPLEKVLSSESKERASTDSGRPRRSSHGVKSSEAPPIRDLHSDANDADQSGAGDTEDAEGTSTSVEDDDDHVKQQRPTLARAPTAPTKEADVGDEDGAADEEEEDEEEDEMDAETRRKLELRERMAKMSGGMGMAGMFGGGIPMGGPPPPKKKPSAKKSTGDSEDYSMPQQRMPMFGLPGMPPPVKSPEVEDTELAAEKDDAPSHQISQGRSADEVPDAEDITPQPPQRTPTAERPPPVPTESKFLIPRAPVDGFVRQTLDCLQLSASETVSKTYVCFDGKSEYVMTVCVSRRSVPPPVPTSDRPVPPPVPAASRPPPPPVRSPTPGSESGDEMTEPVGPYSTTSPRTPSAQTPSKRSSYLASDETDSPDKRIQPMSPTQGRPPPPPPPGQPPSRQPTMENMTRRPTAADREELETEYEGDYDTDIAPGATHKDALKAHARESSLEDNSMANEGSSARSPTTPHGIPPLPPIAPRAGPPPLPPQPPSRPSMDAPRGAPPPLPPTSPPSRHPRENDEDYDPFNYTGPPRAAPPALPPAPPPAPRAVPPPPQAQPPPPQNRMPPALPHMPPVPSFIPPTPQQESSDDDDLYSSPPPRKSHDRPPPPPPQAPPHQHRPPPPPQERLPPPPPPPQERFVPPPPTERAAPPPPPPEPSQSTRPPVGRKSLDVNRVMQQGRVSMDQPRPSISQDFMATEVDLGASSHWWTQPNMPPPSLQTRKDILVDMDESRSGNSIEKTVHVLFIDYSQTVITARFDTNNVSDVQLEQRQDPPPARLRQDQLESAHNTFGARIAKDVESKQNTVVGDGSPHGLIHELLRPYPTALGPISTRAFGAPVYANLANASTQQFDEIRPGDIISFRNAKFQGKHGAMHAKYAVDVGRPDHVGVVVEWDGSKKKVRVWEQGRESRKTKQESFRMGDLRSGECSKCRTGELHAWVAGCPRVTNSIPSN